MSNVETRPVEHICRDEPGPDATGDALAAGARPGVQVLTARDVPLGGPRAMTVRRTLPQRARSLIGAWCFADHYGPGDVSVTGGMVVPPHPHTGLQTVSWLFSGEIEHRDSLGTLAFVRPGELNLMSSGAGICHSEVSTASTTVLHGVQLWLALPDGVRFGGRDFHHYVPAPVTLDGGSARVFLGRLPGLADAKAVSPVPTFSALLGAEVMIEAGARVVIDVDEGFEHGVLVDSGDVTLFGHRLAPAEMGYVGTGNRQLVVHNDAADPARIMLLGGEPFGEEILMWWNFVARRHEEIARFREAWQAQGDQFGSVQGYDGDPSRLPAPTLPNVRIKPRRNPPATS